MSDCLSVPVDEIWRHCRLWDHAFFYKNQERSGYADRLCDIFFTQTTFLPPKSQNGPLLAL